MKIPKRTYCKFEEVLGNFLHPKPTRLPMFLTLLTSFDLGKQSSHQNIPVQFWISTFSCKFLGKSLRRVTLVFTPTKFFCMQMFLAHSLTYFEQGRACSTSKLPQFNFRSSHFLLQMIMKIPKRTYCKFRRKFLSKMFLRLPMFLGHSNTHFDQEIAWGASEVCPVQFWVWSFFTANCLWKSLSELTANCLWKSLSELTANFKRS